MHGSRLGLATDEVGDLSTRCSHRGALPRLASIINEGEQEMKDKWGNIEHFGKYLQIEIGSNGYGSYWFEVRVCGIGIDININRAIGGKKWEGYLGNFNQYKFWEYRNK